MATEIIKTERVQTFFNSLETQKSLLTTCTDLYKTISNHFSSLQDSLTTRSQALDSKIQSFDAEKEKILASLLQREKSIPERESAAASRIEDQKDLAISEIENEVTVDGEFAEVLRFSCRRMDSTGLVRYLVAKRKDAMAMRSEIAAAMVEGAVDAHRLALNAIEEFVGMKEAKVGLADRRWACGLLVQGLFEFGGELGVKVVATSISERAASVAEKWKGIVEGQEGDVGMGAAEAAMFLQMVVVFGLKEKFEEDFLKKLIISFATRRDMAKIALAMGFGEKMGDIIDELVKSGKEIEAVYFASESGLMERFPPISLLKSHLSNSKNTANDILKKGNHSATAKDEANTLELNSIKAVIKCAEDHKLESEFTTLDTLKKRVPLLERAKADRKKNAASTSKLSNKRPHHGGGNTRGSGGPSTFRPSKSGRYSNTTPTYGHRNNHPHAYQAATRYASAAVYNYPSSNVYEGGLPPAAASYGSTGYGIQSPAGLAQQYSGYGTQDVGASGVRGGGGAYGGQGSYGGGYDYSAVPPTGYQTSYPQ